ncbi:MAG: hypothetical protein CMQ38_08075 [Gammaproteobacteria bacterium]|nr:hypothetical protein [Gammaproteobacteria bacterium]|tara:strand:- start:434 stop:739 length:306 start_codon:yes stop_codon:yes gene_type:complete
MSDLNAYLDELKKTKGIETDTALGEFLGIRRQEVSRARKRGYLTDEQCIYIALELGEHPLVIMLAREAAKEKNERYAAIWKSGIEACKRGLDTTALKDYRK